VKPYLAAGYAAGPQPAALCATAAAAAHDKDINAVAVAPNDALVVTASQDRTAKARGPGCRGRVMLGVVPAPRLLRVLRSLAVRDVQPTGVDFKQVPWRHGCVFGRRECMSCH